MRNTQSALIAEENTRAKDSVGVARLFSVPAGVIAGFLIGLLIVAPHNPRITRPTDSDSARTFSDIDGLSADEIQTLIVKALSKLGEQQGVTTAAGGNAGQDFKERAAYSWQDVEHGVRNMRRLLPSVKRWTLETLRETTAAYDLKPSEWPRVTRLIRGVHRIVRSQKFRGVAAVRDNHLSEILVDPAYAPFLASDDAAVFVLAHELTHVAARSGKLDRFMKGVAENAKRAAQVEPTEDQKEDLACDFVGEQVLKRFIALYPTSESMAVRISSVFGYESPAERFARAWEDFCASYNGDPGDDNHLNQYQTIRALLALDPGLQSLMPMPGNPTSPSQ